MRLRRFAPIASLIVLLCGVAFSFQNCTGKMGAASNSSDSGSRSNSASNNGSGYDGKIYAHLNTSSVCADGKPFDSAIQLRDGVAYLVRDHCVDIPVSAQQAVSVEQSAATPWLLRYQGEIYVVDLLGQKLNFAASGDVISNGFKFEIEGGNLKDDGTFLARFDATGKTIYNKSHPWIGSNLYTAYFANGDTLIAQRYEPAGAAAFVFIVRLDRQANVVWSKALRNPDLWVTSVAVDSGDRVLMGTAVKIGSAYTPALLEFTGGGQLSRTRSFGGDGFINQILLASGGEAYLQGSADGKTNLAKLDATGALVWSKSFTDLAVQKLMFDADGNLLLHATFESHPVPTVTLEHLLLVKIGMNDGGTVIAKRFSDDDDVTGGVDWLDSLLPAGDGGFILARAQGDGMMIAKLKADLTLDWSVTQPLTEELTFHDLHPLPQGGFWASFQLMSQLKPYSTEFFTPISFSGWPAACSTCKGFAHADTVSMAPPASSSGPQLTPFVGLSAEALQFPAFSDYSVYLPLY